MPRKLTQGDALERFIKKHGDEYNYSHVEYVDRDTKVKIICKKDGHGYFKQTPNAHIRGRGCPKCAHTKTTSKLTKSTDDFVKQAKEVHPDKNYGYEKVEYVNAFIKL